MKALILNKLKKKEYDVICSYTPNNFPTLRMLKNGYYILDAKYKYERNLCQTFTNFFKSLEEKEINESEINTDPIIPIINVSYNLISPCPVAQILRREASWVSFPIFDIDSNVMTVRILIKHYSKDKNGNEIHMSQYDQTVDLTADNTAYIQGQDGQYYKDFDYFYNLHITYKITLPNLVLLAIKQRDLDGTINRKCIY